MATVSPKLQEIVRANEAQINYSDTAEAPVSFANGDTVKIPMTDKNVVALITASATGNVVFSAGDGIAATNDLTVACTKDVVTAIQLDSSSFEALSGSNAGYCIMTPTMAGTISVISTL